ncbi:MAG: GYD domain-containing protein [Candidatus Methanoperedens sp.]|nr:GYD domain-containing protein [Candidatus Methanoperedens sp.]MCE8428906.1 GYD domain-containing protein [Candidatus Methanoperedens sp.]
MAKFIIISRLTDEGAKTLKRTPDRLKIVNKELETMGVKVLEQFAVLGNFDFLNIVEADDVNSISRAVVELASRGSIKTETYSAIPIDDFIESLK